MVGRSDGRAVGRSAAGRSAVGRSVGGRSVGRAGLFNKTRFRDLEPYCRILNLTVAILDWVT